MTLTWEQHAARQGSKKIYLAEIALLNIADGVTTHTLRLSDVPYVDDSNVFWEPRLKGIPLFSRKLDVLGGSVSVSYGSLEIANPNNHGDNLDEYIIGWAWLGQAVTVKMGFEGLPTADFRTVVTGVMGPPSFGPERIRVTVSDKQTFFSRKFLSADTYSDTVSNLLAEFLLQGGITSIDTTMKAAWAANNNFAAWYKVDDANTVTIASALELLLGGLCCWWGINRAGEFQIADLSIPNPSDSPDLELVEGFDLTGYSGAISPKHYWKRTVEYWSDTTATPATSATVSREDSTILDGNSLAMEGTTKSTLLTSVTDVEIVRDRYWNLFSVRRSVLSVTTKVKPFAVELGGIAAVGLRRYGIDQNLRIIGLTEDHQRNRITMELLK